MKKQQLRVKYPRLTRLMERVAEEACGPFWRPNLPETVELDIAWIREDYPKDIPRFITLAELEAEANKLNRKEYTIEPPYETTDDPNEKPTDSDFNGLSGCSDGDVQRVVHKYKVYRLAVFLDTCFDSSVITNQQFWGE